jgi:regulator of sigma E protease
MEWLSSLGFFGSALRVLILLLEVLIVFNLLIVVHEWGHFLAARWRGLKVEKFYIWFGKPIWKRTFNGVEYGLGSIPFGGFVALPQMAPMDAIEGQVEQREKLPPITPLDKIIVAFAGPLFSFLLACAFAMLVMGVGKPDRVTRSTVIGYVVPDGPGAQAGLRAGDTVLEIDGTKVTSFDAPLDSVMERIPFSQGPSIKFLVQRAGEEKPILIESGFTVAEGGWFQRTGLRKVGIAPALPFKVDDVKPNSPAALAGIQKDDVLTHLNGERLYSPVAIGQLFDADPKAVAKLTVQRGSETREVELSARRPDLPPDYQEELTGMTYAPLEEEVKTLIYPHWWTSVKQASIMMFRTLKGLVTPGDNIGFEHLSGPVKIFNIYYTLFQEENGWRMVLWFSVVLNVNLALMNLIPFPVLDGGHIVMAISEMIRRRPVLNMKWLEMFQTACALLLFGFIFYVTWFDSWDLLGNGKADPSANVKHEDIQFLPPKP